MEITCYSRMFASKIISFGGGGIYFKIFICLFLYFLKHFSFNFLFSLSSTLVLTHPPFNLSNTRDMEIEAVNLNKSIS